MTAASEGKFIVSMLNLTQATTVQTEYVFLIYTKYLTIWQIGGLRAGDWGLGAGD
ncbi:MAG: hypothetical protein V7L11_13040 [Nostoc sp.]|uniref:hypothetical protein n=1 Tax=Nostoc sp. TaxID=1180 RepID=UPI002FF849FE